MLNEKQNTELSEIEKSLADWQRKSVLIVAVLLIAGIISATLAVFSKSTPDVEEVASKMTDQCFDRHYEKLLKMAQENSPAKVIISSDDTNF